MVAAGGVQGQRPIKHPQRPIEEPLRPTPHGRRRCLVLPAEAWAAAAALALYAVTLGFGFVFDDRSLIGPEGPLALGNGTLPYRPLRYASYLLDHFVGGGAPWAYHAGNVALHALVAALTACIARRLGAADGAAVLAGVAMAVHPLGVEAVAYVAGRRDLLATAMGLLAIASWLSPRGLTAVGVACALLAVAAKESGAVYVGVLALASIVGLGPSLWAARTVLLAAAAAAIALPVAYGAIGPALPSGPVCSLAAASTLLATHYAVHMVAPLRLSIEYPALARASTDCATLTSAASVAGFALLGAAVGVVVAAFSRRGRSSSAAPLRFAWAWTGVTFVVCATMVGMHEPGADRHAYPLVAAAAIALAVSARPLLNWLPSTRRALSAIAIAYVAALAMLSALRLPTWRDERALWTAAVASAPESGRAHHNLAGVLLAAGEHEAAATHVRAARDLDYAPAILGDAALACARGRIHRGRDLIERARTHALPAAEIDAISAYCEKKGSDPFFPGKKGSDPFF